MSRVEIEVSAAGTGRIVLDGQDVSDGVSGFALVGDAGRRARLTLHIGVREFATAEGEVRVGLTAGAERALIAAGWTPPVGQANGGEPA